MADGFVLFDDGFVILAVFAAVAAVFEEEFGEVEPAFVAGLAIEFGEAHLNNFVAGGDAGFAVAEIFLQQFGTFEADVEERAGAGGLGVGEAGFVEVAEIVEFVTQLRVFFPTLFSNPVMRRAVGMHRAPGVEVAVGFLRGGDVLDEFFDARGGCGIRLHAQAERCAFDGFVDVRVVEGVLRGWLILEISFARRAATHRLGGEIEVEHAFGRFALGKREGEGDSRVGRLSGVQQAASDADVGEGNRLDGIIGPGVKGKGCEG